MSPRTYIATIVLAAACSGGPVDVDQIDPEVRPTKRSEVLAVVDPPSGRIVVFGGNDGPIVSQIPQAKYLKDTWVLELGQGWTKVEGDGPSKRGRYAASYDPEGRRMLLFGGRFRKSGEGGDYTLHNDLWAFSFEESTWTRLDAGKGTAPDPRYYPASGYDADADAFYVFGGATNTNALVLQPSSDVWRWTADAGWEEVQTSGDAPSTRVFWGDTWDPVRKRIVLFGGQIGDFQSQAYQDTFALDVTTGEWTELNDGTGKAPSTRMHAGLEYDPEGDRYVLFGGHTDIGDANDLWEMDPETGSWKKILQGDTFSGERLGCVDNPSEVPADYVEQDLSAPERRHRGMQVVAENSLWIFGGIHAECSDHLDDTWRFDLATETWVELIEARTGESCARRGDDCVCLCF